MKSKLMLFSLSMVVAATILAGCASKPAAPAPAPTTAAKTDTVAGASQAVDEAAFEQKISKDNSNYMIIAKKDMTFTKDLIVESGVKKDKDGKETPNRSIGLATLTKDNKVDTRFTLTAPRIVFTGENGKIEYGIVKGDVYVQAKGFILKDATIDGNLYFATDDLKNAFKLDATTKITGKTEVKAYTK